MGRHLTSASPSWFFFGFFLFLYSLLNFFSRRNQGIRPPFDSNYIAWGEIMKIRVALIVVIAVLIASQICCDAAAISEVMNRRVRRWDGTLAPGEKCKRSSECRVGTCKWHQFAEEHQCVG